MCEHCERQAMQEELKAEVDVFNAIYQNALTLKLVTYHIKQELIELDADEFFPDIEEVVEDFIKAMHSVEKISLLKAGQAAQGLI